MNILSSGGCLVEHGCASTCSPGHPILPSRIDAVNGTSPPPTTSRPASGRMPSPRPLLRSWPWCPTGAPRSCPARTDRATLTAARCTPSGTEATSVTTAVAIAFRRSPTSESRCVALETTLPGRVHNLLAALPQVSTTSFPSYPTGDNRFTAALLSIALPSILLEISEAERSHTGLISVVGIAEPRQVEVGPCSATRRAREPLFTAMRDSLQHGHPHADAVRCAVLALFARDRSDQRPAQW